MCVFKDSYRHFEQLLCRIYGVSDVLRPKRSITHLLSLRREVNSLAIPINSSNCIFQKKSRFWSGSKFEKLSSSIWYAPKYTPFEFSSSPHSVRIWMQLSSSFSQNLHSPSHTSWCSPSCLLSRQYLVSTHVTMRSFFLLIHIQDFELFWLRYLNLLYKLLLCCVINSVQRCK